MSKTLSEQAVTNVAEIVRHGEKITLPENLSIADAIEVLKSRATYEQQTTVVRQEYSVLPPRWRKCSERSAACQVWLGSSSPHARFLWFRAAPDAVR